MSQITPPLAAVAANTERQTRILDAGLRCFARAGFHRTTMQDVAAEAGMSPGNLYRYFPSKDALIAGIVERDRAELTADFEQLDHCRGDLIDALEALGRKHFEAGTDEKSVLCLEIWAEATRNPAIARLHDGFDQELMGRFVAVFEAAQARGAIASHVDCRAAASIVAKLADGLFIRRALSSDFDARTETDQVFAVIRAILGGSVVFPARVRSTEPSPC